MASFHLISLGCAKNLVDSEVMLGSMVAAGWQLVDSPDDAELLILNTCGFIQPAVEEAIAEIFELVEIKENSPEKKIVVVGCLVQRYKESLLEELPEVDLFLGTEGAADIADYVAKMSNGDLQDRVVLPDRMLMSSNTPRIISTPVYRAWLKITEGCDSLRAGKKTVVCCDYGISRSNAVAVGILAMHEAIPFEAAVRRVLDATGEKEIKVDPLQAVRRALGVDKKQNQHHLYLTKDLTPCQ